MENIIEGLKKTISYWTKIVFPIIFKNAIGGSGMKIAFWSLVSSLGIMAFSVILFLFNFFSTGTVDLTIEQAKYNSIAFCFFGLVAVFMFFVLATYVPAKLHDDQQKELIELKDAYEHWKQEYQELSASSKEKIKNLDRLTRGELIELRAVPEERWWGIEIYNGEIGNPFDCSLYITEISDKEPMNPYELTRNTIHVIAEGKYTVDVIRWNGGNNSPFIHVTGSPHIPFENSGEYIIKTRLEGRFHSSLLNTVDKSNSWKLIYKKEEAFLELRKVGND
jgi:hypothetical protein